MSFPKSDHFDGERFYNTDPNLQGVRGFFDVLRWKLSSRAKPWPKKIKNAHIPKLPQRIEEDEVYITFINHATLLIQLKELTILTDPIFSMRAGPFSWLGPKRVRAPGMPIHDLPSIDVVLVTHNHYDHMDLASLRTIAKKYHPLFIVPLGNAKILQKEGIQRIIELDWWQEHRLHPNQSIFLTPAQHWSARSTQDRFKALWGGFFITSDDLKIFFAGDTGYNTHFKQIRQRYGAADVAMLPIGAYEPRWFMKESHMNPKDAVLAHLDLEAILSIGIHFGTFQLTDEGIDDPVLDLKNRLKAHHLSEQIFVAPENGQTIAYRKKL